VCAEPLLNKNGHLFVPLSGHDWLLDTGAPTSFGTIDSLAIGGEVFRVESSYMGLDAKVLSGFVGHETTGIIGTDIINEFYVLLDVSNGEVTFSKDKIDLNGEIVQLQEFMGIPIIDAEIDGEDRKMFFDTGAQLSYWQDDSLDTYQSSGVVTDFYPGFGEFETETYMVDTQIGAMQHKLLYGSLPDLLGMTLMMAGTEGIIGNRVLDNRIVGYFPKHKKLVFA